MLNFNSIIISSLIVFSTVNSYADSDLKSSEIQINNSNFSCIRDMTKVRNLYVGNLLGNVDATVAVAESKDGGEYPAGSVVQLVPTEAMVKRNKGFNTVTNDWEFFELSVSKENSKIVKRGFVDVVNRFGKNCFACHIKAEEKWDMICETGHGCDPLPVTPTMISVIQKTDPRCSSNEALTEEEIQAAVILQKMLANKK